MFDNGRRVTVDSEPGRQVNSTKTLGLTLGENHTWKNHIRVISKKILLVLGLLNACVGRLTEKLQLKFVEVSLSAIFRTAPQHRMGSEPL